MEIKTSYDIKNGFDSSLKRWVTFDDYNKAISSQKKAEEEYNKLSIQYVKLNRRYAELVNKKNKK